MSAFALWQQEQPSFSASQVVAFRVNAETDGFMLLHKGFLQETRLGAFSWTVQAVDDDQRCYIPPIINKNVTALSRGTAMLSNPRGVSASQSVATSAAPNEATMKLIAESG